MINKSALVTGGSRGIGRGIVLALVERGWQVCFSYHTGAEAAAEVLAAAKDSAGQAAAIQADIRHSNDRQRMLQFIIDQFGKLDLLVNNAGMGPRQRVDLLEMKEASYEEVMSTNLRGPFFLTQQAARVMIELRQSGLALQPVIINIGSISAEASSLRRGEYCISKAGMSMMTKLFADRLAGEGIRVYEIQPGIIATDMTAGVREDYDRRIAEGLLPIQRWGRPEDVAQAVVALVEGAFPYSTGEVIHVDGGFHLKRL